MPVTGAFVPDVVRGLDLASEGYYLAKLVREQPKRSWVRVTKDLESGLALKQNLEFFLGKDQQTSH